MKLHPFKNLPAVFRDLRRRQDGQAMLEYSTISLALLLGAGGGMIMAWGPKILAAFNTYLDGYYYMLHFSS